jgi:succinate dehydrogenase / fumarate reductase cytochrome b subunit
VAAHFMGTNRLIKVFEIILFGGFILHMVYGVIVSIQNWIARPKRYNKDNYSQTSFFSKYMFHTAVIITLFLVIHLADFYIKSKFIQGSVAEVVYNGKHYHDLGTLVIEKFKLGGYTIFYIIALLFLGFHLHHGFQSAFQTLGINHQTYTPIIKTFGIVYTILVTAGFIAIPVVVYFFK